MSNIGTITKKRLSSLLTAQEVSKLLHIHVNTVRRWSDLGLLPAYRIGPRGDRRFRREDIAHFLTEVSPYKAHYQDYLW